ERCRGRGVRPSEATSRRLECLRRALETACVACCIGQNEQVGARERVAGCREAIRLGRHDRFGVCAAMGERDDVARLLLGAALRSQGRADRPDRQRRRRSCWGRGIGQRARFDRLFLWLALFVLWGLVLWGLVLWGVTLV